MDQSLPVEVNTDLIASAMHKLTIGSENLTDVLTDCHIYLSKLNRSDLAKTAQLIDLQLIFDTLNTDEKIQIEIGCLLLKKLLCILPPNTTFQKYSACIERSLRHPDDTVKSSILSELEKILIIDNTVDVKVDLICTIVDCLTSRDISVSYNAVKCLKQFRCIEILSVRLVLVKLQGILEMDADVRTRLYDVLFYWAKSVDALTLISCKGLFSELVPDIMCSDVTLQMVVIQMLMPLCTTEFGFEYLESVGVVRGLYRLMNSYPVELTYEPEIYTLNPIVIEFFINIALIRPHLILTRYPRVFVAMYETLKEPNALIGAVINAVSSLASSWDCKIALDTPASFLICDSQENEQCDMWSLFIMELSNIASSTKTELKAGAIQAITRIIQIENGSDLSSKNDMMARTHKWYKQMRGNDPLKNIVYVSCTLPFSDIQQAGFELLLALAEQPWGQEEINKCPSLMDIVFKNCSKDLVVIKDLKKTIIKTLLESDTSEGILSEDLMSRIQNNGVTQSNINSSQLEVSVEDMSMY